jgi:uncharacterized membrane protein YkvA (DUF1232 family)
MEVFQMPKNNYSEKAFLNKLINYARLAGQKVVYSALLLFYALKDPNVPKKAKGTIIGALGYFVFPFDIITDIVPIAGYTDDLGVLLAALIAVALFVSDDTKLKAKNKLKELFGENINDSEIIEVEANLP